MGRLVKAGPPPGKAIGVAESDRDTYVDRVTKYIPAEIVAGYAALSGIVTSAPHDDPRRKVLAWALFWLALVVTPIYLYAIGKPTRFREQLQLIIPTVAFVLWAYTLGGPFQLSSPLPLVGSYASWIGALLVGIFTWLAGLFKP
jgi:hypothetical protein